MQKSICLFALLFTLSCSPSQKEQASQQQVEELPDEVKIEQKLFDEVMLVHDEMMPKMENLMQLKGLLTEKSDSLRELANEAVADSLMSKVNQLKEADDAMMGWMRQFDIKMKDMTHEEKVEYLTTQKQQMDSVKVLMVAAMQEAEKALDL